MTFDLINIQRNPYCIQWRSQYRGKGAECPLDGEKNVRNREKEGKSGKREENRGKNQKQEKSGRKGQNREGSFTLPLLTNRAGYATDCIFDPSVVPIGLQLLKETQITETNIFHITLPQMTLGLGT